MLTVCNTLGRRWGCSGAGMTRPLPTEVAALRPVAPAQDLLVRRLPVGLFRRNEEPFSHLVRIGLRQAAEDVQLPRSQEGRRLQPVTAKAQVRAALRVSSEVPLGNPPA
jgi:hypothetical protein